MAAKLTSLDTVATQLLLMLSHHCLPVAQPALALTDLLRGLTVLFTQYKYPQSGSLRQGWSSEAEVYQSAGVGYPSSKCPQLNILSCLAYRLYVV